MKKLKIVLSAILLFFGLGNVKAEIVITTDQETSVKIADVRSLTFDGDFNTGNLVVNYTDGTTSSFPINSIQQISFKEDEINAIESVSSQPTVAIHGDMLLITTEGGKVTIYDTVGRLIAAVGLNKGTTPLSLSHLPAGIYVANINGHTIKFQKK